MSHLASFGSNAYASYEQTSFKIKHRTPESDGPLPMDAQTPRVSCHQKVISFKLVFQFYPFGLRLGRFAGVSNLGKPL